MIGQREGTMNGESSCLPSWPQYCRVTPTECCPFLGKPVSSMIQALIARCARSPATPARRPLASIALSTTARCRQNEARTGSWPQPSPAPSPPPAAPRSCAPTASSGPGNPRASAPADWHGQVPGQAPRHRPQIALHSPHSPRLPFRSPNRSSNRLNVPHRGLLPRAIQHRRFCELSKTKPLPGSPSAPMPPRIGPPSRSPWWQRDRLRWLPARRV